MARSELYKGFFDIEKLKEEESRLTLQELQKLVMKLSKRVTKLEQHCAKF